MKVYGYLAIILALIGVGGAIFYAGKVSERSAMQKAMIEKDRKITKLEEEASQANTAIERAVAKARRESDAKYSALLRKSPELQAWHDTPVPAAAINRAYGLSDGP